MDLVSEMLIQSLLTDEVLLAVTAPKVRSVDGTLMLFKVILPGK